MAERWCKRRNFSQRRFLRPTDGRRRRLYGESDKSRDPSFGLGEGGRTCAAMNTFDDLPPTTMVFTFSSTSDSAESLRAMSSKSAYYPKPISGSRLFVESATLVIRAIDPSGAISSLPPPVPIRARNVIQGSMTLLKDIAAIFMEDDIL